MINATDIGWVAGFLEGEGSFGWAQSRLFVTVSQKDREPLDKLNSLVAGRLYRFEPKGRNPIYRWECSGPQASGLMMTVFSLMSARRRDQIAKALGSWRSIPAWTVKQRAAGGNTCKRS